MQGLRQARSTYWKNLFSGHSGAAWECRSSRCPWFRPSRRKGTKLLQLNPTSTEPLCWALAASLSWLVFNLIPFLSGWSRPGGTCGPQRTSRYWNSRIKGKTGGGDDCLRNRKSDADCDWIELRIVFHIFNHTEVKHSRLSIKCLLESVPLSVMDAAILPVLTYLYHIPFWLSEG